MSNETAPVISRNNVSKTLTKTAFGKKSNNPGVEFYYPETNVASFGDDLPWYGVDYVVALVNKSARLAFGDIFLDHKKADGSFDVAAWEADCADFTAGVAKLGDLKEELERVNDINVALAEKASQEGVSDEESAELMARVMESNTKVIKPLRAQIKSLEAKYAERVAKRKAKEAASETQTAAPVAA